MAAPTAEEFTADMNVEVGRLKLEIILVQLQSPPHYDLSPRRSHVTGTGLDKPGVSHTVTQQTEQDRAFTFQAGVDVFCVPTVQGSRSRGQIRHLKQTLG